MRCWLHVGLLVEDLPTVEAQLVERARLAGLESAGGVDREVPAAVRPDVADLDDLALAECIELARGLAGVLEGRGVVAVAEVDLDDVPELAALDLASLAVPHRLALALRLHDLHAGVGEVADERAEGRVLQAVLAEDLIAGVRAAFAHGRELVGVHLLGVPLLDHVIVLLGPDGPLLHAADRLEHRVALLDRASEELHDDLGLGGGLGGVGHGGLLFDVRVAFSVASEDPAGQCLLRF